MSGYAVDKNGEAELGRDLRHIVHFICYENHEARKNIPDDIRMFLLNLLNDCGSDDKILFDALDKNTSGYKYLVKRLSEESKAGTTLSFLKACGIRKLDILLKEVDDIRKAMLKSLKALNKSEGSVPVLWTDAMLNAVDDESFYTSNGCDKKGASLLVQEDILKDDLVDWKRKKEDDTGSATFERQFEEIFSHVM